MTQFLISDEKPEGFKLEDLLVAIRNDVLLRCQKIVDDDRREAKHVLRNNMRILQLLGETIDLAEDSTETLDRAFGPSTSANGGRPRIGQA